MDSDGRDLTLDQAAARLGISPAAMRKRLERGSVRGVYQRGVGWRVPVDAVDAPSVTRPVTVNDGRSVTDATDLATAILALAEAIRRDEPRPGKPAPWWRWLLFGEVRARE
jgi:predicted ArsR family transcriptional regulator